ncbi:MAG: hypothetical protein MUO82_08610 [Candidatus Thermoplasmatota archaeon]|nr:hypothetical protein [Candidatus Thermoplasmatota archaeon]
MPFYVSFLKENGVTFPQGTHKDNNFYYCCEQKHTRISKIPLYYCPFCGSKLIEYDRISISKDFSKKVQSILPKNNHSNLFDLGYHPTQRENNCPDGQFLTDNYPSEAMRVCNSKPLTCTPLRIIQKNYEIIPLTEEKQISKRASTTALSIFKTEILEKLDNIDFKNESLLNFAKNIFNLYIDRINEQIRYILIEKKEDYGITRKLIFIDCIFSKSYQKKVKKRMNWLIYKYGNANAVTLVLTLNPKLFGNNKYFMWITIKKELNRFLTALKYYFKKSNIPFPSYICTIESQKEPNSLGNPHLHFVFLNAKRLLDWRKIRKLWHLGHISINRTYDGHIIRHPINYITKYITKTFTKNNDENLLTQSLVWLFNIRSFSTTRGLITPIKPKSLGKWKPICLIIGNKFFELFELPDLFSPEFDFDGG